MPMTILSQPYFRNEQAALSKLEALIWPHGPICLHCGATNRIGNVIGRGARPGLKFCCRCRKQFRATMGTVFEGSHIPIHKWLQACFLLTAGDTGISAHQLHLRLDITNKTALGMVHRLAELRAAGAPDSADAAESERTGLVNGRLRRVRWRRRGNRGPAAHALGSAPEAGDGDEVPWAIPPAGTTRQYVRFLETAHELGCRDDEAAFERVLARIVRYPAPTRRARVSIAASAPEAADGPSRTRSRGARHAY
ncbi:MAG TPA: IS1595 family transposase [Stellaceae bacterium]|nr:IS1595 family transposase [Stellaceae bacterium]